MPWGLKRFYGSGDLHFITCSCYHRRPLLASPSRRDLFLQVLEEVRQRYAFVVVAYVVMPEHFHLLISEPQIGDPSVVIQAVKIGFARTVIHRDGDWDSATAAHIWQRRFYDFNVWGEKREWRRSDISIGIRFDVGSSRTLKTGSGAAFERTHTGRLDPSS